MKMPTFTLIAALLTTQFAFAGANNAVLTCKSASGRTKVNANFPVDLIYGSMSITVDDKTVTYVNKELIEDMELNGRDSSELDSNHKVVELHRTKTSNSISMTALTDTGEKFDDVHAYLSSVGKLMRRAQPNGEIIRFRANLRGMDPRNDRAQLPVIAVTCVYDYSI